MAATTRRVPARTARQHVHQYQEGETTSSSDLESLATSDEDDETYNGDGLGSRGSNGHSASPQKPTRRSSTRLSLRPRRNIPSNPQEVIQAPIPRPAASPRKAQSRASSRKRTSSTKRKELASPLKRRKLVAENGDHQPHGVIPNWRDPRIPFDCWVDVFLYAARDGSSDMLSGSWLVHSATVCRYFAEAALAALYRRPYAKTSAKAKRLVGLLGFPPSETFIDYRMQIDTLHIDIQTFPQAALYRLISPLPRLKEVIIFTTTDQPPYRELDKNVRWNYPADLFHALTAIPDSNEKPLHTRLKSWEWSGKFLGGHVQTVADLSHIHQTEPFAQLTSLSFTNMQVPSLHKTGPRSRDEAAELQAYFEDGVVIEKIGHAIAQLKCLKHLTFESSTVLEHRLLVLLPKNLLHFELINCWEVNSEDLSLFLRSHGSDLHTLTLLHNQSLNLEFLTELADACPKLRDLRVNLSYFRHHDSINDANPDYAHVLLPHHVPQWPSTLRVISIEHIRDWSVQTAEMFMRSLINSAKNLPDLRYLAIKSMLDIPWQARATFRLQWRDKMDRVFLRSTASPKHFTTLNQSKETSELSPAMPRTKKRSPVSPSRRSGRIAEHEEQSARSSRTRTRHRQHRSMYQDPDTDEDEFELSEPSDDEGEDEDRATNSSDRNNETEIQGMCSTVSILFDNQKVRELQYGMEDFQSESDESEDEWNGDEDEDDSIVIFR